MGEAGRASTLTVNLAEILYLQGQLDEADRLAQLGGTLGAEDDVATQIGARYVHGKVLARTGSIAEGERLVREAWNLAEGTGYVGTKAEAAESLAEVLALAGQVDESRAFLRITLELHEGKGNVILAERTRARLAAA